MMKDQNNAFQSRNLRIQKAEDDARAAEAARSPQEQAAFDGGLTAKVVEEATGKTVAIAYGVKDESAAPDGFRFDVEGDKK